jgi:hypothetical protein
VACTTARSCLGCRRGPGGLRLRHTGFLSGTERHHPTGWGLSVLLIRPSAQRASPPMGQTYPLSPPPAHAWAAVAARVAFAAGLLAVLPGMPAPCTMHHGGRRNHKSGAAGQPLQRPGPRSSLERSGAIPTAGGYLSVLLIRPRAPPHALHASGQSSAVHVSLCRCVSWCKLCPLRISPRSQSNPTPKSLRSQSNPTPKSLRSQSNPTPKSLRAACDWLSPSLEGDALQ